MISASARLRSAFSPRFRTRVEIIGPGISRPIRQQPDGRKRPRLSNTGGYGYMGKYHLKRPGSLDLYGSIFQAVPRILLTSP